MAVDIFKSLNSIKTLSNSSLSGILNGVNVNFETLSTVLTDYLTIINFNQAANSMSVKELTVETIHLTKLLHIDLFGDGILDNDLRIDDQGRIYARSFIGELSEVERLRLKPLGSAQLFLETGLPQAGIPGDVVFTGVDFFGYMGDSIGWKSLTFGSSDLYSEIVSFDDSFAGSPGLGDNVQIVIQNLYTIIQNLITSNTGDVDGGFNLGSGYQVFAQKTGSNLEFRTFTASGGVTITQSSTELNIDVPMVIGIAEDGDYTDGVFTDFTTTTPIGTAVDRFNELFKSLVPPPSPILSNWDGTKSGTHVTGKLSFDDSNPIGGSTYIGANNSPTAVNVDGTWTIADHPNSNIADRFGICSPTSGDITMILNYQVTAHPGTPTPAYLAQTFGDADKGELKFYVNGVEDISKKLTLTTLTSLDSTSGGTTSGLTVGVATPSYFAQGDPFNSFYNRTGTARLQMSHSSIVNGYNYVHVVHEDGGNFTRTLARIEFIIDHNNTATSYSNELLHTLSMTGSKKLSGIDYHTGGTSQYNIDIDNAYRNTYSSSASAISHTGNSNSYGLLLSASSQALANCGGNELLQVNILNKIATLTSSNRRIINGQISLTTTTLRTIQGSTTSSGSSINNILLDNFSSSSTDYIENFDDENYRLLDGITYDLISHITSNPWDSIQSLNDGSAGHTTGLQVTDGKLIYPTTAGGSLDYRTTNIINGSTFNDGGTGGTGRNYTALGGNRTFIRYFRQVSPTTANFTMNITGSGGTFVSTGTALTGNNIHVEIKAPTETGWMDAYDDFVTGQFNDGDGARSSTLGAGRAFGTTWGLTIGTKSTANTSGYMIIKITVGPSFTGNFTGITFSFV